MPYSVIYLDKFAAWLDNQDEGLQLRTLAQLELLKDRGPLLNRPYIDTLKGSELANLKELRLTFEKAPIRILFAFDPKQQAIVILAGNKQSDKRWYDVNIPLAEKLYKKYLAQQKANDESAAKEAKK